jgi:hypothetical protein
MPREAARKRCLQSPVFRQTSPDSHVFPHLGHSAGKAKSLARGVLMGLSGLLPALPGVERHLRFTCPDERGMKLSAATRTSTRRVR